MGGDSIGDGPHGKEGFLERSKMDRSQLRNVSLICWRVSSLVARNLQSR